MKKLLIFILCLLPLTAYADIVITLSGQSNAYYGWMTTSLTGTDSETPHEDLLITTDGTNWAAPTGNAAIAFGNAIIAATGEPVKLIAGGVGGAALNYVCQWTYLGTPCGYWLAHGGDATYDWTAFASAVTTSGLTVDGNVWLQGETEAGFWNDNGACEAAVTGTGYQTDLVSYFAQLRTLTGANNKIVVGSLNGCDASCSYPAGGVTGIRTQQSGAVTADGATNSKYVDLSDLSTGSQHYSATDNITVGERLAASMLTMLTVNGTCGTADGVATGFPTSNLCATGTAGSVSLTGTTFSWTCSGDNGGSNDSCSAAQLMATMKTGASYAPIKTGASYAPIKIN